MDELHYLLGNSCNLDCDFCFWEKMVAPATLNSAKHIIDEIKGVGVKKITISGGEPTCAPNFLKVLKYAKENGLEIILHTNGLKIEKELARKIAPLIARVSLTLDGSSEEMAIKMRKKPLVAHTLFLINLFNSLGSVVNVKTLVTKVNKDDIMNIGKLLEGKPIQYWSLLEFNPIGRGLINKSKYYLSNKEFKSITSKIIKMFPDMQIRVREFKSKPNKYCFITAGGDVYTNLPLKGDIIIGNLNKNTLCSLIKKIEDWS